jgi:tetratricopeptide (TPR) repeat protein
VTASSTATIPAPERASDAPYGPARSDGGAGARTRIRGRVLAPFLLAAVTLAVFQAGLEHEFTNWDDVKYITHNPLVHGLSLERVKEAFTRFHLHNYNPLHLVSYMVDHELWGLDASGFFFTSLLLHIAGGILIYFLALHWLGSTWHSFWVASVFLIHPTRVESVAWLSERKDVLSGLFAAASLLLYSRSLDAPSSASSGRQALLAGSFLSFLLALLSKSQVLLLPFVLVAMDACRRRPLGRSLAGKAPFLLLTAIFAAVTIRAHGGDASSGIVLPDAILDPLAALPRYVAALLAPLHPIPYHDHSAGGFHGALPVALGAFLVAVAIPAAIASWRRERVVLLGIVWFLAFLAPVLGFVKIRVWFADRYLYLAAVGPAIAIAHALVATRRFRVAATALQAASIALMAALTMSYLPVFRDSETLWSRVLEAHPGSSLAHSNLAAHLVGKGRFAEAAEHYDADLAERPFYETSILGRAILFEAAGDRAAARRLHDLALEHRPASVLARTHYADFLERAGDTAAAIDVLLGLDPAARDGALWRRLSDAFRMGGRPVEAVSAAQGAVERDPHDPRGWLALALSREAAGDLDGARAASERALALAPGWEAAGEILERLRIRP